MLVFKKSHITADNGEEIIVEISDYIVVYDVSHYANRSVIRINAYPKDRRSFLPEISYRNRNSAFADEEKYSFHLEMRNVSGGLDMTESKQLLDNINTAFEVVETIKNYFDVKET